MTDLDASSLELDAKRRAYYARKRKHIKENIEKTDMGHTPVPQEDEDPELISARTRLMPILSRGCKHVVGLRSVCDPFQP